MHQTDLPAQARACLTRNHLLRTTIAARVACAFAAPAAWSAEEIQSIVVTAQARKQLVQDVPIAISTNEPGQARDAEAHLKLGNYGRANADVMLNLPLSASTLKTGTAASKFDLRPGWDSPSLRYGVALLVNNLFDQRYITSLGGQTQRFGSPYAYLTPPRTIAVELRASL